MLILGGLTAPSANATEVPASPVASVSHSASVEAQYRGIAPEKVLTQGLADEGLAVKDVEVGVQGIDIEAAASKPSSDFAFDLELAPGKSYGEVAITDRVDGQLVTDTYDIAIKESTVDRAVFTLTDQVTGESYTYDSSTANTSVAFVIPVAFAAVSLSTALYYLAIGAAIVIGGVLALEAAKAVSKIIAENNRRSSSKKRDYYTAVRSGSKVFISPSGLTYTQAQNRGRAGGDVWAISRDKAKSLAKILNRSGNPIGAEKHGAGYLWHFHPYRHAPNMHSFYGSPS
ncbi:hypothetical protein [Neomicrococcus lactis]|uniref:hypothetical protein n=1 Tax=Neomicrococcus lactis TaxID=732241 RepID=UPI0023009467|nr:hypothetical protein [Neomicrococcus lactis]